MRVLLCLGAFLTMASCSSPAKPPASETPSTDVVCGMQGHGALYVFKGSHPALDTAQGEYDAAGGVGDDHAAAARHYLACAAAYRDIPDDFPELDLVISNTRRCYQSAIIEYYNGRLLEREGRAAVTAALAAETRVKPDIEAALAAEKECGADE